MGITTVVFDAYGTLFDITAAARRASAEFPALAGSWPRLAADWRSKQLEYSWIRALTGQHADFWQVTGQVITIPLCKNGPGNVGWIDWSPTAGGTSELERIGRFAPFHSALVLLFRWSGSAYRLAL